MSWKLVSLRSHLVFMRRTQAHQLECRICGLVAIEPECVAVQFSKDEPPERAAVFCVRCIDDLTMARAIK